jgi:hypothetical protein
MVSSMRCNLSLFYFNLDWARCVNLSRKVTLPTGLQNRACQVSGTRLLDDVMMVNIRLNVCHLLRSLYHGSVDGEVVDFDVHPVLLGMLG